MSNTTRTAALALATSAPTIYSFGSPSSSMMGWVLQVVTASSPQFVFAASFDGGTTYKNVPSVNGSTGAATAAGGTVSASAGDFYYVLAPGATHIKVTTGSGSGTAVMDGLEDPIPAGSAAGSSSVSIDGVATAKAEDAQHASGDYGIMALTVRKDTPVALAGTDADYAPIQTDSSGRIYVNGVGSDTVSGVTKVENQFTYVRRTTSGAFKSGPGLLHSLFVVGTDAAATAGTIDIYDNTVGSGNLIFSIPIAAALLQTDAFSGIDVAFANGLYVVFTTTADVAVTVSIR